MIDGSELAGQIEWFRISSRCCRDETKVGRGDSQRSKCRDRFKPTASRTVDIIGKRKEVGEKDRGEMRGFRFLGAIDVITYVR